VLPQLSNNFDIRDPSKSASVRVDHGPPIDLIVSLHHSSGAAEDIFSVIPTDFEKPYQDLFGPTARGAVQERLAEATKCQTGNSGASNIRRTDQPASGLGYLSDQYGAFSTRKNYP
jgi:hypothetical protein